MPATTACDRSLRVMTARNFSRPLIAALAILIGAATGAAQSLPTEWASQDIGAVGLAGRATYSGATFTIQGAGADIWGTADSFHFANRLLIGDGQIVARVASMGNTHAFAKAGVMIREALTGGSRHVLLDLKPGGGGEFMARNATGGVTSYIAGGTGRWLKLARSNGVFTAWVSTDGASWTLVGSRAVSMAGNVWVGLAVCSHNTSLLNTALFDSVTVASTGGGGTPPTVSITSPQNGATFTAGSSVAVAASAAGGGAPVARVDFYANGAPIGTDTTSPYSVTWANAAAGSYSLTAVATDTANQATTSSAVGITVSSGSGGGSLPAGWANRDIGAVGIPGSASFGNGTFTLRGAGADIWVGTDAFHFASKPLVGTGEIVAHVASMSNTHRYAKAGVMIRNSSSPNSPHVTLDMRPDGTVELIYRSVQGGATFHIDGGSGSWLRLVRGASDQFTAYVSTDGNTWRQIGSVAVTMSSTAVEMGLIVCSHTVSALNTATFDHVSHNSPPAPRPAPVITSPPSGTTFLVGSSPVVTATASENVVIDFYVNNGTTTQLMGTFNNLGANRPPTFMWFGPQAGTYSITAVAHYSNDEWVTSNPITIHVSSTPAGEVPPTVRITNPPLGQVTGTQVTLTGETRDPDSTPVVRVDYWLEEWFYDYPARFGLRDNASTPVPSDRPTLAAVLRAAGYRTAAFVSAFVLDRAYGFDQGFDVFDARFTAGPNKNVSRTADEVVQAVLPWLEQAPAGSPFFAWVHFYDAHAPYAPPEPYRATFRSDPYDGEIAYIDNAVGKLLAALEKKAVLERTLVVAIGDHGESLGEHGEADHGLFLYDSVLRIPWLMRLPGRHHAGSVVREQVRSVDLLPTVLDLLGVRAPGGLDGASVVGPVRGRARPDVPPSYAETFYGQHRHGWSATYSLRVGEWKLIDAPTPELYDLRNDDREASNLLDRKPAVAARLGGDLREMTREFTSATVTPSRFPDRETLERLRSLGYVGAAGIANRSAVRGPDPKDRVGQVGSLAALVDTATAALERNRPDVAIISLRRALVIDDRSYDVHLMLGDAYLQRRQFDAALGEFDAAALLHPQSADPLIGSAAVFLARGHDAVALDRIRQAEAIAPRSHEIPLHRGIIAEKQGRLAEAFELYRKAVDARPSDPRALARLAEAAVRLRRWDVAAPMFASQLEMGWQPSRAHLGLGRAAEARGDAAGAAREYTRALALDPGLGAAHEGLARVAKK